MSILKQVIQYIKLDELFTTGNVRLQRNLHLDELLPDIAENGITDPITVVIREKGKEIIKGHRRTGCVQRLKDENPEQFEKLFGNGIPAIVLEGVSEIDAMVMKVDQGNQLSLTHDHEVQKAANALFTAGKTEKQVAVILNGVLNQRWPMKAEKQTQLEELRKAKAEADSKGLTALSVEMQKQIDTLINDGRRGKVQNMHYAWRCPEIVMVALDAIAEGVIPEGEKRPLPQSLTYGTCKKLYKAFEKDMKEVNEKGNPKYGKLNPGPFFKNAWQQVIEADISAQGKAPDEPAPKSMSAKAIDAEITEGKYQSSVAVAVARHCKGDKEVEWAHEDKQAFLFELVKREDPKLAAKVVEVGEAILKKMVEATPVVKA